MIVFEEIFEAFPEAERVTVINQGRQITFVQDSAEYGEIILKWNGMTDGARQMPAYGVSLDKETRKALQSGLWLEFDFGQDCECSGMCFQKLLIEVQREYSGFNVVRYSTLYGYDGRCYYVDLVGKNMAEIYNYLINL